MSKLTVTVQDKKKLDKLKTLNLKITNKVIEFRLCSRLKGIGWFTIRCDYKQLIDGYVNDPTDNSWWYFVSDSDREFPHPHIEGDTPCLGDFAILLNDAIVDGRIYDAIYLCKKFLSEYSESNAFCSYEDCLIEYCAYCGYIDCACSE